MSMPVVQRFACLARNMWVRVRILVLTVGVYLTLPFILPYLRGNVGEVNSGNPDVTLTQS